MIIDQIKINKITKDKIKQDIQRKRLNKKLQNLEDHLNVTQKNFKHSQDGFKFNRKSNFRNK